MRCLFARLGVALAASSSRQPVSPPSSSSSSFDPPSSGATEHAVSVLSLQPPHVRQTPAETFQVLTDECRRENIDAFDVYGDFDTPSDPSKTSFLRRFERTVADELGFEDAVFMPSGVMAQSIALLIHSKESREPLDEPSKLGGDVISRSREDMTHRRWRGCFACHESSHLLLHEEHGYRELLGMEAVVLPSPPALPDSVTADPPLGELPLDFATVQRELDKHMQWRHDDPTSPRLATLLLEVPHRELGGKTTIYEDIVAMKRYCLLHNLKFHCDGARIFEASAAYQARNVPLRQLLEPFDSVYVSFYKGLGGMSGAMLLGPIDFCHEARVWLRRFGGNLYTLLPYAVSGYIGFRRHWLLPQHGGVDNFESTLPAPLSFVDKRDKMVDIVAALSFHPDISRAVAFDPEVPIVNMVHGYLRWDPADCQRALDAVESKLGIRVLVRVRPIVDNDNSASAHLKQRAISIGYRSFFEWSIGEGNGRIPTSTIVEAWAELAKELLQQQEVRK